jgi:hypothetical protein
MLLDLEQLGVCAFEDQRTARIHAMFLPDLRGLENGSEVLSSGSIELIRGEELCVLEASQTDSSLNLNALRREIRSLLDRAKVELANCRRHQLTRLTQKKRAASR